MLSTATASASPVCSVSSHYIEQLADAPNTARSHATIVCDGNYNIVSTLSLAQDGLNGGAGTPTSNAYACVNAYMCGMDTSALANSLSSTHCWRSQARAYVAGTLVGDDKVSCFPGSLDLSSVAQAYTSTAQQAYRTVAASAFPVGVSNADTETTSEASATDAGPPAYELGNTVSAADATPPPSNFDYAKSPYFDRDGVEVPLRYGRQYYDSAGKPHGWGLEHIQFNDRWTNDWQIWMNETIAYGDKYPVRSDRVEYWQCYQEASGHLFQILVVANPQATAADGHAFGVVTIVRYEVTGT